MRLQKAAYIFYKGVRRFVSATGLTRPARKFLGPLAGRFFLRLASESNRSFEIHGHRMVLASGDRYPPIDMAIGRYEQQTTNLFLQLIRPGMVVLDVGAHVGYYTLLAARQVGPDGKVYAFEPEPNNHTLLLKNIELNGYHNVVVARTAVADQMGSSTLYLSALDNGRHSVYRHNLPEKGSIAVDTTTVDAFLESEGWPKVNLIKIDVEGAEMPVLAGMAQLLKKSDDLKLILEFNPHLLTNAGSDPLDIIEELAHIGFSVASIDESKGPQPLDGPRAGTLSRELLTKGSSVNLFCSRQ